MHDIMDQVESKFLQTQKFLPRLFFRHYWRYFLHLDSWWNGLKNFMMEFDNFNRNTKFTDLFSEESITFLYLNVKLSTCKLQTFLNGKPIDYHQYLQFQSSYPKYTKRSILYVVRCAI